MREDDSVNSNVSQGGTMSYLRFGTYRYAAQCLLMFLSCGQITGCGLLAITDEASVYRREQAKTTNGELNACLKASATSSAWDQSSNESTKRPDCYMAAIAGSVRPLSSTLRNATAKPKITPGFLITAPAIPVDHDAEGERGNKTLTATELAQVPTAPEAVNQVAWMALLSKMSYRRFVDKEMRGDKPDSCTYKLDLHPLPRLYAGALTALPDGQNIMEQLRSGRISHWELWKPEGVGCVSVDGLFYETYVYRQFRQGDPTNSNGRITQAVVVFRGTENHRSQFAEDWGANGATAINVLSRQHQEVRRTLPELIKNIYEAAEGPIPIYATGHSLGGGLAQTAAYLRKEVTAAYVFNSSPATAWTILRSTLRKAPSDPLAMQVQDPNIIRVMQDDEALGLLRTFSNAANSTIRRTGRTDLVVDFPATRRALVEVGAIGGIKTVGGLHSITLLACNLAARVANSNKRKQWELSGSRARSGGTMPSRKGGAYCV
jgi:hypothetical protein